MSASMPLLIGILKATALLVLALGITFALRRAPAGARYVVWLATLVALLLVPVMNVWAPIPLKVLPSLAREAAPAPATPAQAAATAPAFGRDALSGDPAPSLFSSPLRTPAADAPVSWASAVLLVWASVVVLIFSWLALGALKVRGITRRGRTLTDDGWLTPLYETADRLELDTVPRLVMSGSVEMPFACGIRQPTIVLPTAAERWNDERRRVVLFHELAHIRRRDLLGHTVGRIVCAAYWFHPMVWSAAKKLRAESERACDDLVIACGAKASDYATHLLDIVTGVRRHGAPATALAMANKREFEGRMLAILDPSLKRSGPSVGQQALLAVGLGSLALSIAAISPVRRDTSWPEQRFDAMPALSQGSTQGAQEPRHVLRPSGDLTKTPTPSPSPSPSEAPSPSPSISTSTSMSTSTVISSVVTRAVSEIMRAQGSQQAVDTALLGKILRTDRDAEVRRAAAWALQGRREGVPLLLERLRVDSDASVREMSAWALAGYPTPDVIATLTAALRGDKDAEVRGTAAWALGTSDGQADVAQLVAALSDSNTQVRHRALWAIGQQRLSQAPPRVVALLKDPDEDVRMMAGWVLGQILDPATIPAIREAFLAERDSDVAQTTFRALLFMGDRSQVVIDRAMSSDDPQMRARGVRMIAGQGVGNWPWPWPWPWPRPSP
jgi:beta-lactamase regulating signal transducer with metallopeptidase domain